MEFKIYDTPQKGYLFSKQLIDIRGHQCECCKNTQWLNKPINLEVHHKNGNKCDCTENNLQLLCPNCHSYTDNFGSKNLINKFYSDEEILKEIPNHKNARQLFLSLGISDAGANYKRLNELLYNHPTSHFAKNENTCIICGNPISDSAKYCETCFYQNRRVVERPSKHELKKLVRNETFVSIGRQYGVSDNAIRKWCIFYNLPKTKSEIKKYTDEEWEKL